MLLLPLLSLAAETAMGATHYVANNGADESDGLSPDRPWKTIAHVNAAALEPGDTVLLRRGDHWREPLRPRSGSEAGYVTYGAYGEGPKPLLLGSVSKARLTDWQDEGHNIWATTQPAAAGQLVLQEGTLPWGLYCENGAAATCTADAGDFDSAPESARLECASPGQAGSDVQLILAPFSIRYGKTYRISFRAKCTAPFQLRFPFLMMSDRPWTSYAPGSGVPDQTVGPDWETFTHYYQAGVTAEDARLTWFLGGAIPQGAVLHLDSLTLEECETEGLLYADVGNLILDGGRSCGIKVWEEADLKSPGQYWYDDRRQIVKMCSPQNPAEGHQEVECALRVHQVDQSGCGYVTYENLWFMYGGAHGIGGGSTHHIIVRDCDFGFIGGGDQMGGDNTVRFGNGIEFWGAAHDNLVERCRLWEVYDAALTNQNAGAALEEVNITYRHNLIWNCEYSFEYWNHPAESVTRNIRFENNTCLYAGHGWGHAQRPDPSGRHLCFYTSPAQASEIHIRNNTFFGAVTNAFYAPAWEAPGLAALDMDHNLWYQASGVMISFKDRAYAMADFARYQTEEGKEPHSIIGDPLLADPSPPSPLRLGEGGTTGSFPDFHLRPGSPCIDAGMDVGTSAGFDGTPVPQGRAPDIGAYEFRG